MNVLSIDIGGTGVKSSLSPPEKPSVAGLSRDLA